MLLEVQKNKNEIEIIHSENVRPYRHYQKRYTKKYSDEDESTIETLATLDYIQKHQGYSRHILGELIVLNEIYPNYYILSYDVQIDYIHEFTKNNKNCYSCETIMVSWFDDIDNPNILGKKLNQLIIELKNRTKYILDVHWVVHKLNIKLIKNPNVISKIRKRTNIPRGLRHEVFKRDKYTCKECGAKKSEGATLHIDHIIPISKGGTDELSNLQTLCADCNLNKSNIIQ